MDKLLGLVEVTGSCIWNVQAENYGGFRFDKREYFQSAKGQCYPGDFDEAAAALHDSCEAVVRRSVTRAIAEIRANGGEPVVQIREPQPDKAPAKVVEMPAPQATTPAPKPQDGKKYHVGEKPPTDAPQVQPPAPTGTTTDAPKPQTVIANRMKAAGVTPDELTKLVRVKFGILPEGKRYTQQQYVDAFTAGEKVLTEMGLEKFRTGLASAEIPKEPVTAPAAEAPAPATAPAAGESVVFSTDPAVVEARKQVSAKWPMWGVELTNVASLWCADQVKDVGALDAFLISAGVDSTTGPGRIESLLGICRHLSIGTLPGLIQYAKATKKPMSMIEADLSNAVGKPIRFALDLPNDAVALALGEMFKQVPGGKA